MGLQLLRQLQLKAGLNLVFDPIDLVIEKINKINTLHME